MEDQDQQQVDAKTTKSSTEKSWTPSVTTNIWRNRISWRIASAVFATLLLIQTIVLIFTVQSYEAEQLNHLQEVAKSALTSSLENVQEQLVSPINQKTFDRLMEETPIRGLTIYGMDYTPIKTYGLPTLLRSRLVRDFGSSYRSADNQHYEVMLGPTDLGRPYHIVTKLDASDVEPRVVGYIHQTLWILLLMSALVTSVLMLVLNQWLLEPVILLRNNLLSAAKNPEQPDIRRLKHEMHDEVGVTIRIANDLIRQNANNLKRLRTQAEDKIHKLAYFDGLTGLPNRTYFLEKLGETIKTKVIAEDGHIAVIAVDIDHFKDINDTMGHEIGDKLLEAIGRRLVKALPEEATVARASADEFTVMVPIRPGGPDSPALVERIFSSVSEPVSILKERFQVRVSVGVAQCPDDGIDPRQILKNADISLNRAKEEGRDTVRYYSHDFDLAIQKRFQILRDLRVAMDQGQLRLHYQPQFDLKTGRIVSVEALLRWWRPNNSKEGGAFISPAEFIPVAEQSGLIVPIGEYVLRTACAANKRWQERGIPPFRMAVNISSVQFHRADIVGFVETVLKETRLDSRWLELEVTESAFMENVQLTIDTLNRLHRLGIELAVDDFGTGYSSLSYLRQFPIDRLKIDQSFIRDALSSPDDRTIVKIIIALGHNLDLKVIAEGVETAEHEKFLTEEGCDEAQGFKYSKAIPEDQLVEYVVAHNRALAQSTRLTTIDSANKNAI